MLVEQYFAQLEEIIADYGSIRSKVVQKDKRSEYLGYFKAELYFLDGSALHVREFVLTQFGIEKYTYVYHYQTAGHQLIFRYDDTKHFPDLPNSPHHKHTPDEVISAVEPSLRTVLDEIIDRQS